MVNSPNSALVYIRVKTRHLHDELETKLEIVARLKSSVRREAVIVGYRTMHWRVAAILEPWLPRIDGLVPFPLQRPALSGITSSDIDDCEDQLLAPVLTQPAEVLGFYYVMQGAMLGGRMMLRELEDEGVDITGLGFLNPHGDRASQVWRDCMALLERSLAGNFAELEVAVVGARKGYAFALDCLGGRAAA